MPKFMYPVRFPIIIKEKDDQESIRNDFVKNLVLEEIKKEIPFEKNCLFLSEERYSEAEKLNALDPILRFLPVDALLKEDSTPDYFIHITKKVNVDRILSEGLKPSLDENNSFGPGIYCYRLSDFVYQLNDEAAKISKDYCALVFYYNATYFECMAETYIYESQNEIFINNRNIISPKDLVVLLDEKEVLEFFTDKNLCKSIV